MKSYLLPVAVFAASINAVHFSPKPTPSDEGATSLWKGWTPKPTPKTEWPLEELRRRQTSSHSLIGYNAADNTCGFISGNLGNSLTCANTQSCAAVSHSGSVGGLILCCDTPNTCFWFSSCVNSAFATATSVCDDLCQKDNFVLKCTASTAPYCAGFSMSLFSASIFSCDSIENTLMQFIDSTYNGEHASDFTSWVPVFNDQSSFTSSSSSSSTSSSTSSSSTISSSSTTSSAAAATTSAAASKGSSTNVGAIAGGVVGGLAVLGAVVVGLVWMCLRNRKRRNNETNNPTTQTTQPTQQYPPPMQQQDSTGAQHWQQPGPSPPMAAAYAPYDPNKPGFQSNTYPQQQQQPLLAADYNHPHGHPGGLSPPTSPAPQYTEGNRQSMVKPEMTATSPVSSPTHGHDGAQEVEARPHVPNLGRDGVPLYEVQ